MSLFASVVACVMSIQLLGVTGYFFENHKYELPYLFQYQSWANLHVNVSLENVPYYLDYKGYYTVNGFEKIFDKSSSYFVINKQLWDPYININLYLYNNTQTCMYELMKGTINRYCGDWSPCFDGNSNYVLHVNLLRPCHANFECKILESNTVSCTLDHRFTNFQHYSVHQRYHQTSFQAFGSTITGYLHTLVFNIKVERFDLNSAIIAKIAKDKEKSVEFSHSLMITEKDIVDDYAIMNYSDAESVTFSCAQYVGYAQYNTVSVGFVDNSGETITMIPGTIYNKLLDVNRNGSMLCCLYYEISYANGVQYVNRVVANKTLLIYKKDEVNNGVQNNANFECKMSQSNTYSCKMNNQFQDFYHRDIYQIYQKNSQAIGSSIRSRYNQCVFNITIERFDINTAIIVKILRYHNKYDELSQALNITEKDIVDDHNYAILNYTDMEPVKFSCERYVGYKDGTSVGLINSSGENITTIDGSVFNQTLDVKKNGSVLCCIYYEKSFIYSTQYINRVIANKTLLLYINGVDNMTQGQNGTLNVLNTLSTNMSIIYVAVIPVAILLIMAIAIYVFIRKRSHKTENSDHFTERSISEDQDVNYATLDLAYNGSRPIQSEEPQYAQIIKTSKL